MKRQKKPRNVYIVAFKLVVDEMKRRRSIKPLKLMLGKHTFERSIYYKYYGIKKMKLVDYIKLCRIDHYAIVL